MEGCIEVLGRSEVGICGIFCFGKFFWFFECWWVCGGLLGWVVRIFGLLGRIGGWGEIFLEWNDKIFGFIGSGGCVLDGNLGGNISFGIWGWNRFFCGEGVFGIIFGCGICGILVYGLFSGVGNLDGGGLIRCCGFFVLGWEGGILGLFVKVMIKCYFWFL